MAVGVIFDPEDADGLIREGSTDMVALARGVLFDPHWVWSAAAALGKQVTATPQYARAADFDFLREKRGQESGSAAPVRERTEPSASRMVRPQRRTCTLAKASTNRCPSIEPCAALGGRSSLPTGVILTRP